MGNRRKSVSTRSISNGQVKSVNPYSNPSSLSNSTSTSSLAIRSLSSLLIEKPWMESTSKPDIATEALLARFRGLFQDGTDERNILRMISDGDTLLYEASQRPKLKNLLNEIENIDLSKPRSRLGSMNTGSKPSILVTEDEVMTVGSIVRGILHGRSSSVSDLVENSLPLDEHGGLDEWN
ncbi:uncharacterized protein IL334_006455 [Kwoniella shivajii]|uniref:Uncharacterized protein n=1 Tax=Kwoniella shivajii TaxID=564305 RepID=A0ABZ1D830_9TREE|nr:hypothetical protein IL334_006455 [Kwoniella shivajii]